MILTLLRRITFPCFGLCVRPGKRLLLGRLKHWNQLTFLGQPLLLVRDHEGTLRVFQNVCRHRGMILVSEPKKIEGAIRCPYHSWCYSHDGALVATPHVGGPGHNTHPGIDKAQLGLLDILSSDYYPASLLDAAFRVADDQSNRFTLPQAVKLVTKNPAQALNLQDRGQLVPGQLADFIGFATPDYQEILYQQGKLKPAKVWKRGELYNEK